MPAPGTQTHSGSPGNAAIETLVAQLNRHPRSPSECSAYHGQLLLRKGAHLAIAATIYWGSECMNYSRLSYPANDLLAEPSGFLAGTAVAVS